MQVPYRRYAPGQFGEPSTRSRFAMAFPAGGSPACCAGIGILRALHKHDRFNDAQFAYLSGVSGGVWALATTLLENTDGSTPPVTEILAPIHDTDMRAFTLKVVSRPVTNTSGLWIASLAPWEQHMVGNVLDDPAYGRWWSAAFGEVCLQPLQLYRPGVPCVLVNGVLPLGTVVGLTVRARAGYPIPIAQMTLVSGTERRLLDCSPYSTGFYHQPQQTLADGLEVGGRVTTSAFHAVALAHDTAQLDAAYRMGADAFAGLSSCAPGALIAQFDPVLSAMNFLVPQMRQSAGPTNRLESIVDGGLIDSTVIMSLLARQQAHVVLILNPQQSLRLGDNRTLSPLFGTFYNAPTALIQYADDVQVFPAAMYATVVAHLLDSMRSGTRTGLHTVYRLPVLTNTKHGISAYVLDSLTLVCPEQDQVFLQGVPAETRAALLQDNPAFPHYTTLSTDWTNLPQLSVIGSNGLARYFQFVGETYLLPRLDAIQSGRPTGDVDAGAGMGGSEDTGPRKRRWCPRWT